MSAKRFLIFLLAISSLATSGLASAYSSVVVYGDSLSDDGTNFYPYVLAATGLKIPDPLYYSNGRRSNGPVAVEQLATALGAPLGLPLVDHAYIGATTGVGNYGDGGTVTSLGAIGLPGMSKTFEDTKGSLGPYVTGGLFIVWGGPNDFLTQYPPPVNEPLGDIIANAVTNEVAIVAALKGMGVNSILVPGMPDLGLTPYFRSMGPSGIFLGTYFTDTFNAALLNALQPYDVLYFDTASLLRSIVNNPTNYGFTNSTDACFDGVATVCSNPNSYVFYDDFHPTTATHAILAGGFLSAVPEPATLFLILPGLGLLIAARRRAV